VHEPLTPQGAVDVRVRVAGIHDKGSGALVVLEQEATARDANTPVFTSTVGLFVRGEGGFGGEPAPKSAAAAVPERDPDDMVVMQTLPVQTALYRHAGNDTNPVHVDPAFARRAGFDGPILTGQNTLGIAARALVHTVADGDPARLGTIGGRFVAPAYNGDELRTEIWHIDATTVTFRVVSSRDATLVDRGHARLR
jgi:acyl dehydratase